MTVLLNIFAAMLPYLLCSAPIIAVFRIHIRKKRSSEVLREVLVWTFLLYCVGIASQTLLPTDIPGDVNFMPFRIVRLLKYGGTYAFVRYFLCNIFMLMPISMFSCLLYNGAHAYRGVLVGLFSSVFIEIVQLFVGRSLDIDDIILNTVGAVLGVGIYMLFAKLTPEFVNRCRVRRKEG